MLKYREPNGKTVILFYGNNSSNMLTMPIRLAKKYKLYKSDITSEERGRRRIIHKEGKISDHDAYLYDTEKKELRSNYSRIPGKKIRNE